MLTKIRNLYILGVVAFSTRAAWLPPHDLSHLSRDLPMGFLTAFMMPGVGLNLLLLGGEHSAVLVFGGSFAFWLLLKQIGKRQRAPRRTPATGNAPALPPGWEGWSRERTYRSEWEDE